VSLVEVLAALLRGARHRTMKPWVRFQLARCRLRPADVGLLAGIPKSGNTYMRFLLANYRALCREPGHAPLSYVEMSEILGGLLGPDGCRPDFRDKGTDLSPLGVKRFYYTHRDYVPAFTGWRIVHLFRNPLDHLVSLFFYKFANRRTGAARRWLALGHQGPRDLLFMLDSYFQIYVSFRRDDVLRICYEDLYEQPEARLSEVLGWLGVEDVDPEALARAVGSSSQQVMRTLEDRDGPIHSPPGFAGRFVRDGTIGQHRAHFGPADWSVLERTAARYGVSLLEFRFEPRRPSPPRGDSTAGEESG
jgi:hypothetical protein